MTKNIAFNEDNMQGMARFPDKFFDLAIVDPPYFSGPERRNYYGRAIGHGGVKRVEYGKSAAWNIPGESYFNELCRVSKEQIVWGCNYFDYKFKPGRIVWDKVNQGTTFSDCELASCTIHDSVRLFRFMWNGMMQGKSISEGYLQRGDKTKNQKRIHPTEKPIELYAWLLQQYAKPGFKILDTHLGSGSHRIAAWELGFEFYGFEIDPKYFEKQEARFQQHISVPRLFEQKSIQLELV